MIVEERNYVLQPTYTPAEYLKIYEVEGLPLQRAHLGKLLGYFVSEIGTLNQLVHLWGYEDLKDRAERRAKLAALPEWESFLVKIRPMLMTMNNRILTPTAFSPLR